MVAASATVCPLRSRNAAPATPNALGVLMHGCGFGHRQPSLVLPQCGPRARARARCCGFGHCAPSCTPATLAACRLLRIRPLGGVPRARKMPPTAAAATRDLPRAHEVPLLPPWPHACRCGFGHCAPSPVLTKCHSCFSGLNLVRLRSDWPRKTRRCSGSTNEPCGARWLPAHAIQQAAAERHGRKRQTEQWSVCAAAMPHHGPEDLVADTILQPVVRDGSGDGCVQHTTPAATAFREAGSSRQILWPNATI